ncbi:MAG: carboxymuconolactone decarboxylase family protein [bacterium]
MSSEVGVAQEKILDLSNYASSPHYSNRERIALEYAECITHTDREVTDELFERLKKHFSDDEIVELTATIAWENCSSKFNRAFRIKSQGLWPRTLERSEKR